MSQSGCHNILSLLSRAAPFVIEKKRVNATERCGSDRAAPVCWLLGGHIVNWLAAAGKEQSGLSRVSNTCTELCKNWNKVAVWHGVLYLREVSHLEWRRTKGNARGRSLLICVIRAGQWHLDVCWGGRVWGN